MYIPIKNCILAAGVLPFKGVLHVGAHRGEEAEDYEKAGVKQVLWIEGNPELMDELKKNTEKRDMNQFYLGVCLSDKDEDVTFNVANNGQSSSILELGTHAEMYPHIKYTKSVTMQAYRMDGVVRDFGSVKDKDATFNIDDFDFLNLDVQGAELKVLRGFGNLLSKPTLKAIYTEVNFEHVYKDCCLVEELDNYLLDFGFKRILTAAPEGTWGDSLYARV